MLTFPFILTNWIEDNIKLSIYNSTKPENHNESMTQDMKIQDLNRIHLFTDYLPYNKIK